jgi:hypothetical protein
MTRITTSEHVLLLLRERLQRMERGRAGPAAKSARSSGPTAAPMARLKALSSLDQLSEEDLRRTLVRSLLSEELGEAVANDPSFQAVADDVFRIISASEDGRALIERASSELRAGS